MIMLRLQTVQKKDRDLLWNINQKHLYEMTNFYGDPMDDSGNYHYRNKSLNDQIPAGE